MNCRKKTFGTMQVKHVINTGYIHVFAIVYWCWYHLEIIKRFLNCQFVLVTKLIKKFFSTSALRNIRERVSHVAALSPLARELKLIDFRMVARQAYMCRAQIGKLELWAFNKAKHNRRCWHSVVKNMNDSTFAAANMERDVTKRRLTAENHAQATP